MPYRIGYTLPSLGDLLNGIRKIMSGQLQGIVAVDIYDKVGDQRNDQRQQQGIYGSLVQCNNSVLVAPLMLGRHRRLLIMLIVGITKILIRVTVPNKGGNKPDKK